VRGRLLRAGRARASRRRWPTAGWQVKRPAPTRHSCPRAALWWRLWPEGRPGSGGWI